MGQDVNLVLKKENTEICMPTCDEVLLTTNRQYKHYKANGDRTLLKKGLFNPKHYGATGSIKYYQGLIPKQLADEVLRNLHGDFARLPGITMTTMAYKQRFCYPNMAQLFRKWVMWFEECVKKSRTDNRLTHLH